MIGDCRPVVVLLEPPLVAPQCARYEVIGEPPVPGAWNHTTIRPFPTETAGAIGRLGTVFGITAADAAELAPGPFAFVANTVHVYVLPFVKPVTVIGDARPARERAAPPLDDVQEAVNPVMAEPPSAGATNVTVIRPFPPTTAGGAGASGRALGTTATDAGDTGPSPSAFVANTVHVYVLPFVKPVTVIGDDTPPTEPAAPPSDDEHAAVYPVIAEPPSAGATNVTTTLASPATTDGCAGASGTVLGTTATDAGDTGPSPSAFVANTVHVYVLPFVKPVTVIGDDTPPTEPAAPPSDDEHAAVYPVIAEPPSAGATNVTTTLASPATTDGCAGASGTVLGTTATDAGDTGPSPSAFVANTVHVYVLPFVKPVTVIGDDTPPTEPAAPPSDDEHAAVYPVIAEPPSAGATNVTTTLASPATTDGCAGASGTVLGTTATDAGDTGPSPSAFVANTVHVYVLPFVKPVTVIGDDTPPTEPAAPPSDDEHAAVYPVIAEPPSAGATNVTTTLASPATTDGCAGASGGNAHAGSAPATVITPATRTPATRPAARPRRYPRVRRQRSDNVINPPEPPPLLKG